METKTTTQFCVEFKTSSIDIVINAFREDSSSGFIVNVNDDMELFCLDDEHVARELSEVGIDESTIEFLIKQI
jgi:hypothetical protein